MKLRKVWMPIHTSLLVLFFFCSAHATEVFVRDVRGRGADPASLETIQELIQTAVTQVDGYELSMKKGADLNLKPKLLRLGDSYILKIDKVKGSKILYSAKMKATTLSDMDVVAVRVVRSVLTEVAPGDSATVTDVTEDEETRGTRRYQATRQWRFAFGPAWSSGLNVDGGGSAWSIGYVWGLDPDYDLKLIWSIYSPRSSDEDDAYFRDLNLGINYFFSRGKSSPFASAGIGHTSAAGSENDSSSIFNVSDDTASGWSVTLGAGYKFFRTSNVNVGVIAETTYLFDETEISNKAPSRHALSIVVYY